MPDIAQAHVGKPNPKKALKKAAKEKLVVFKDNPSSVNSIASLREIVEALVDMVDE